MSHMEAVNMERATTKYWSVAVHNGFVPKAVQFHHKLFQVQFLRSEFLLNVTQLIEIDFFSSRWNIWRRAVVCGQSTSRGYGYIGQGSTITWRKNHLLSTAIIWTIVSALIWLLNAFPSSKFLYLITYRRATFHTEAKKSPTLTMKSYAVNFYANCAMCTLHTIIVY